MASACRYWLDPRRNDGSIEKLQGCDAIVIDAGEAVIIQTSTAGGWGKP
jgi:5-oxoprolinase (ATP-hydrolysing)